LDKISWYYLTKNDFSSYFNNKEKEENKKQMILVHNEIKTFIYCMPCNILSCLPKGGCGYVEMLSKYKDF